MIRRTTTRKLPPFEVRFFFFTSKIDLFAARFDVPGFHGMWTMLKQFIICILKKMAYEYESRQLKVE